MIDILNIVIWPVVAFLICSFAAYTYLEVRKAEQAINSKQLADREELEQDFSELRKLFSELKKEQSTQSDNVASLMMKEGWKSDK